MQLKEKANLYKTVPSVLVIILTIFLAIVGIWAQNQHIALFSNSDIEEYTGAFVVEQDGKTGVAQFPYRYNSEVGKTTTFVKELKRNEFSSPVIHFYSKFSKIRVYLDGTLYSSFDEDPSFNNLVPRTHWHTVTLPEDYASKVLKIQLTPEFKEAPSYKMQIYSGDKLAFTYFLLKESAPSLIMGALMIVFGAASLVTIIVLRKNALSRRIFLLGLLSIFAGIWIMIESRGSQLFCDKSSFISYLCMESFAILPFLVSSILMTYRKLCNKASIKAVFWLSLAVFFLFNILQAMGIYWVGLLPIAHILFGVILVTFLLNFFSILKKSEAAPDEKALFLAIVFFSAFAIIDILRYAFGRLDNIIFCQIGILGAFVCIFHFAIRAVLNNEKALIYKKLAYTDMMSGLKNRSSFEEKMQSLRAGNITSGLTVLVADLNNLKYINDNLGHAMGDDAIITVGALLKKAFDFDQTVYRIGGDEFCVIAENYGESEFSHFTKKLDELIEEEQSRKSYPLVIAYATAEVDEKGIDHCLKTADRKMYERKGELKKEAPR